MNRKDRGINRFHVDDSLGQYQDARFSHIVPDRPDSHYAGRHPNDPDGQGPTSVLMKAGDLYLNYRMPDYVLEGAHGCPIDRDGPDPYQRALQF